MRRLLVAAFLCVGLCAFATESKEWSDSGIFGPKYADILAEMEKWATASPGLTQIIEYGKSVKGKPLRMLMIRKPGRFASRPALLMTGSTHGNEYLNLEDRLPPEILKLAQSKGPVAEYLNSGGVFLMVPILNPDGYDSRRRENANGVDLNRDWDVPPAGFVGFKEVETRVLAQTLDRLATEMNLQYKVTIDYHCCVGALLHPWSYKKEAMPAADAASHQAIGDLANKNLKIEYGTTGDILGYYPMGTTKDYYYVKYGANAFTYEGRFGKENEYLTAHVAWWEAMVGWVNAAAKPLLSMLKPKATALIKIAD